MPVNMKREVLEHEIRDFLSGLVFGQGEISDSQAVTNATKRLADNIERRYPIRSCEDFSNYATSSVALVIDNDHDLLEKLRVNIVGNGFDEVSTRNTLQEILEADDLGNIEFKDEKYSSARSNVWRDWLEFAADCVDWLELSKHYIKDAQEWDAENQSDDPCLTPSERNK